MKVLGCIKSQKWLCIALVLILIGSIFGGMFNSSFYSVDVSRVTIETERGTLRGILYMPDGAGPNDPRPVIITTHGYLNSGEMQDAPAVEMSRRGYIVLALDMYDHGKARWANPIPVGAFFDTFWVHGQFDAARWAFNQPWTLRDADGNGIIALSGHSMGGFSSIYAVLQDERQAVMTGGPRMIHAAISVGADLTNHLARRASVDDLLAAMGSRYIGFVAGMYDEFFFNTPEAVASAGGPVQRYDWTQNPIGQRFIGGNSQAGRWFTVNAGIFQHSVMVDGVQRNFGRGPESGQRIIFTPSETHPWNHFSATTTGHLIDFYHRALSGHASPNQSNVNLGAGNQIWQWKAVFNFVTLVGIFLLVVPVMGLLLKLPVFKWAVSGKNEPIPMGEGFNKVFYWIVFAVAVFLPAFLIPTLMERRLNELAVVRNVSLIVGGVLLVLGVIFFIMHHMAEKDSDRAKKLRFWGTGGFVSGSVAMLAALLANTSASIMNVTGFFVAPTVNTIGYWAIISAVIAAFILTFVYFFTKKSLGATSENYGLSVKADTIVGSLLTAIAGLIIVYAVVFIFDAIFLVDGRLWTLAIMPFTSDHLFALFRYAPFYLIFYFLNVIAVNAISRGRKMGGLIAVLLNAGGIAAWVAIQYIVLFSRGVAWYPTMALNTVLLFALIPILAVAALYARRLYEKTNNVFLAAFTNTIFFTMITLANTAVFWNMGR